MKRLIAAALTSLTLSFGMAGNAVAEGAAVTVEEVQVLDIVDTRPVIAQLVGTTESKIATRTAGVISEVLFDVGDHVRAEQDLVRLDTSLMDIQLRSATAALEAARAGVEVSKAQVRLAEQGLKRMSRLQSSAAFSKGQFEDLQQNLAQAQSERVRSEAQVAVAAAAVARIEYDLTHAVIRAPYDGVIIERQAHPGEYISLGEEVAVVLDVKRLEIEADMPVELAENLRPGLPLQSTFNDGTGFEAEVRMVLPVQNVSTRTRPVRLRADFSGMPGISLAAGKNVTLAVPVSAPRQAPMVAKDALVQSRGGWTVFVVKDGVAEQRDVMIGEANGARLEVLSGLTPGDLVVVRGNERLRPGQPVSPSLAGGGSSEARSSDGG